MKQSHKIGLLGFPLGHSFSRAYFQKKFSDEGLNFWDYLLLERADLKGLKEELSSDVSWRGFNVTIPHKSAILSLMDAMDPLAERIAAVNVVKVMEDGKWQGFNSDYHGFLSALFVWKPKSEWPGKKALILGNGGSAKAVKTALQDLGISVQIFARNPGSGDLVWHQLSPEVLGAADVVVNCTPLGMSPNDQSMPEIPYDGFRSGQFVLDLVYNPAETRFMAQAESRGAFTQNGLLMLQSQAEKAWEIWNSER